jgi:TM2 domain-containing membrane protein YozV
MFVRQLPELRGEEAKMIHAIISPMTEQKAETFAIVYRAQRKDPVMILILCLLGFFGIAGIHRIFIEKPGSGILYLLTLGLCFIGTIVDLFNFRGLALQANMKIAMDLQRQI